MSIVDRWLLPDGVQEVLPPEAANLEKTRRQLLDLFSGWGYELVIPPMVEFLDSLLTGTGTDLDLKTFKVTDQISGRMMGIRADITPQVARIDAHSLNRDADVRLCYAGTVMHAKADNMLASRTPISVGAELFGNTGADGDLEMVSLMIESLATVSGQPLHLELGDVGIFRALMADANLAGTDHEVLFDLIQGKAMPDLKVAVESLKLAPELATCLVQLPALCGGNEVLDEGKRLFAAHPDVVARIENLEMIALGIKQRFNDIEINYDLSELRGYNYHTGIVFATYLKPSGVRIAKGGRYDDVGKVFGRSRGATGFDIDLRRLVNEMAGSDNADITVIAAVQKPESEQDAVSRWQQIKDLRDAGNVVIEGASEQATRQLVLENGQWIVK